MINLAANPGIPREEIVTRLKTELVELLCLESSNAINEETRLAEDLDIDSLGMVDLVMQIEDCFNVVLPTNSDLSTIKTFGDVVDLLDKLDKPRSAEFNSTATN